MEETRIKNLIKAWRQKSHNEGDQFASFVFIWFCFNAWMEHISDENTDKKMINELAGRKHNMQSLFEAYDAAVSANDEFLKSGVMALMHMSKEKPIEDMRKNPRRREPPITIKSENDFENIVQAIYRIRCNLFHGGKDADDIRDQVLVKNAAMVLRQWIGCLITHWKI